MGANDKLREYLTNTGVEREVVDFVVGVEDLRVARGCQPLPAAAIPVAQIRAEAKDCLTVAGQMMAPALQSSLKAIQEKERRLAELMQRQVMPQQWVSVKTEAPARAAGRDERGQPSAVSKALSRLETQRAMTMYWDPEGIDDPSY